MNDSIIEHEAVSIEPEILRSRIESVSGKLEFISERSGQFLYSIKVDSVFSEIGFRNQISKSEKIYCISSTDFRDLNNSQIGLVVKEKVSFHTNPFIPFVKDKKVTYYEIENDFSITKSIFFEYFGLYRPRGYGVGIAIRMYPRGPSRKGIFKIKTGKFNKLEKEIFKIKTKHNNGNRCTTQ